MAIFEGLSLSLNIVSFDVPFPANYGGVIDVYYKLYWLKKAGVNIHLHCFAYGRKPSPELEALCEKVYYYPRKTGLLSNLSLLPYTVKSRQSAELKQNLLSNNYPVLFEVLHTCWLLRDPGFKARKKIYRHSNIEHDYYAGLAQSERRMLKRIFLRIEAWKLKRFESILSFAGLILAVNEKDTAYFRSKFPAVRSVYLPSFHANESVSAKEGKGEYILFHGNLSISENYEAAQWLIENVLSKTGHASVIAGLDPPVFLKALCSAHKHIKLVANAPAQQMDELIANAQAHVLFTAQPTGLKLKLLNVLFKGRFIICNAHMLSGTGLHANGSLFVASDPKDFIEKINACFNVSFTPELIEERQQQVARFDNVANAQKLIGGVF